MDEESEPLSLESSNSRDLFTNSAEWCEDNHAEDHGPRASTAGLGHNLRVSVRDLQVRAPQHERVHIDERDLDGISLIAADPSKWRAFPVIATENGFQSVDGTVLLKTIYDLDPDAKVEIAIVDEKEALRIRSQENSERTRREPMAKARRARILSQSGMTHAKVAEELRLADEPVRSVARISQYIAAAEAETEFPELCEIIFNPAQISIAFWERIAAKVKALQDTDKAKPLKGASRVEEFRAKIAGLRAETMAASGAISDDECLQKLDISSSSSRRARARHIGKKHAVPGTDQHVGFKPSRVGGAAISLPHTLKPAETRQVFEAVMTEVTRLLNDRATSGMN
jgi:hypothetical protein